MPSGGSALWIKTTRFAPPAHPFQLGARLKP
jgi:hypothetical protein